ncbi:hypothetical protein POJ06DRAFT_266109 [Lipomyces tetrasporus]|uniref:CCR4-NOT transcription complex subunit 11 n=1 Tax=Lipomyces tetrasporus TaxID=54092 RepID=A0AAD7VUL4_9ASCO|nr:uncharacterized protein POJ06DRAFT_266109 [Lipomyces tetrasporus]KAJ8103252.1 hypothetical protein POJ06DRAFT_266109 [Lipomyces tetrasporus]
MLSDEVTQLLSDFGRSLSAVSASVVASLSDPDEQAFYLACDVLFMLEELHGSSEKESHSNGTAIELMAKVVNGEYLLYKLYEQYGLIELNPFLAHFVDVYNQRKRRESQSEVSSHLHNIQASIVSLFLSGETATISDLSAAQFAEQAGRLAKEVDMNRFVDALVNQGVLDPPDGRANATETGKVKPQGDSENVQRLLVSSLTEEISEKEVESLINVLKSDLTLLMSSVDLSINAISSMLHVNPALGRSLITLLLSTILRADVLQLLQYLPPTLPVLEALNHLLVPFPLPSGQQTITTSLLRDEEKSALLHPFLSNATRTIESGAVAAGGENVLDDTSGQTRQVQLLCLFIQSLLRTGAIMFEEYIYEIQTLTISFVYVPEARELFQIVQRVMKQQTADGRTPHSATQYTSVQVL